MDNKNNRSKIDHLYELYGYEKIRENNFAKVYRYRQGMYYAVDILQLSENVKVDNIKKEFADIGYATEVIKFFELEKIRDLENRLFFGFFEITQTLGRLKNKYKRYQDKLSLRLGAKYEYITCPYKVLHEENFQENESSSFEIGSSILDTISNILNTSDARLILIEAAAGFGKTSTIYELLDKLTSGEEYKVPILIELSKNRQAKIIKHVLLNEFEEIYPYLKYELILNEIQSGKIPLIIDGFDELLYSTIAKIDEDSSDYEDIQAMLQTIGEIVRNKAKIILTTRRTAVLSGDDFFNWIIKNCENFTTTRILIEKPKTEAWIGSDRYESLSTNGIPINYISNPVLLSYIRNLNNEEFDNCCKHTELLIESYFEKLLTREQERQKLYIEPLNQIQIFKNLSKNFIEYRINSDDKNFIKELIIYENEPLLKEIIQKYPPSERPSLDDLAETLCNHALLDRKGSFEKQIGFINDFVYGYLIALLICSQNKKWIECNFIYEQYIELASIAFKLMQYRDKKTLHDKICYVEEVVDHQILLMSDIYLLDETNRQFNEKEFSALEISDISIGPDAKFRDCIFTDCVFTNVKFYIESFEDVSFIGCFFRNCDISGENNLSNGSRWILGGEDYGSSFIENFTCENIVSQECDQCDNDLYEKKILEQFWLPGREFYTPRRKLRTLYRGFDTSKNSPINVAIRSLIQKGWLIPTKDSVLINKNYTKDIMVLLGRA